MSIPNPGLTSIVIVGAGPSGLLLALLLTTLPAPIPKITILDARHDLDPSPRATHHGPPAIAVLRRAGILSTVRERGYVPSTMCWRKLDGTRLVGFDHRLLFPEGMDGDALNGMDGRTNGHHDDDDYMTILNVGELGAVLVEELGRKGVRVTWGERVVGIGGQEDGAEGAWVEVEVPENGDGDGTGTEQTRKKRYEADFVVGCDGGNSAVRKLLFGRSGFKGFTWDEQIVATNTYYDGLDQAGWEDTNYIIHPEHWYMAAKITKTNLWRISYGEIPGLSDEELLARQPMKFEQMLPGNPKPGQYKIVNISPYKVHQRCVEHMAVGRVALVADAAHLCNPFGGLGLTGGMIDAEGLFDCLRGIHCNAASPSILGQYSEIRKQRWHELVNPISTVNLKRLAHADPETVMREDEFMKMVEKAESDTELSKQMQNSSRMLRFDFTQLWDKNVEVNGTSGGSANGDVPASAPGPVTEVDTKTAGSVAGEAIA